MIYQLKEVLAIEPILKLIFKKKDIFTIEEKKLVQYFLKGIADDNSIILIDEKDEDVRGVLYASIEVLNGEDTCFIHICLSDPKQKNTVFEFIARLRRWCAERNIEYMHFLTGRNPEAFARKYKFENYQVLLRRKVKEEGHE